jgi:hypothetical protein
VSAVAARVGAAVGQNQRDDFNGFAGDNRLRFDSLAACASLVFIRFIGIFISINDTL